MGSLELMLPCVKMTVKVIPFYTPIMADTTPDNSLAEQAPIGKTAGENAPPSTVEEQSPSIVEEHLHSTSEAEATDIPSANAPDPTALDPEVNPNATGEKPTSEASTPDESASSAKPPKKSAAADKADKPAAKKEKAPAVEDKPFAEFMQQYYLPALQKAFATQGVPEANLEFTKQKVAIAGYDANECWQVKGSLYNGLRQFNVYFPQEDIQGQRAFSCNEGSKPSTLESFLIDERKVTLDLLVFGVIQRLNGQKWLTRN